MSSYNQAVQKIENVYQDLLDNRAMADAVSTYMATPDYTEVALYTERLDIFLDKAVAEVDQAAAEAAVAIPKKQKRKHKQANDKKQDKQNHSEAVVEAVVYRSLAIYLATTKNIEEHKDFENLKAAALACLILPIVETLDFVFSDRYDDRRRRPWSQFEELLENIAHFFPFTASNSIRIGDFNASPEEVCQGILYHTMTTPSTAPFLPSEAENALFSGLVQVLTMDKWQPPKALAHSFVRPQPLARFYPLSFRAFVLGNDAGVEENKQEGVEVAEEEEEGEGWHGEYKENKREPELHGRLQPDLNHMIQSVYTDGLEQCCLELEDGPKKRRIVQLYSSKRFERALGGLMAVKLKPYVGMTYSSNKWSAALWWFFAAFARLGEKTQEQRVSTHRHDHPAMFLFMSFFDAILVSDQYIGADSGVLVNKQRLVRRGVRKLAEWGKLASFNARHGDSYGIARAIPCAVNTEEKYIRQMYALLHNIHPWPFHKPMSSFLDCNLANKLVLESIEQNPFAVHLSDSEDEEEVEEDEGKEEVDADEPSRKSRKLDQNDD